MVDPNIALALYPFNSDVLGDEHKPKDLSFTAGSVITDIKEIDAGWWEGSYKNARGIFPANFVSNKVIGCAKCVHTYYASQLDELNIKKGDDIRIYEKRQSGWLRVICNGKGGLIPPTHIRELKTGTGGVNHARAVLSSSMPGTRINQQYPPPTKTAKTFTPLSQTVGPPPPNTVGPPPPPSTVGPPPQLSNSTQYGKKPQQKVNQSPKISHQPPPPITSPPAFEEPKRKEARVLYAYAPQHPGDLELIVGTIVHVTKNEGGWWEGKFNGSTGIFPANYVEMI